MIIKAYNNEPVTISGGVPLDVPIGEWVNEGQIRAASFPLEKCGEIFQGKNRLLPARSPNVDWGFNKNVASGEYHYMKVRNEIYSGVATQVDQKTPKDSSSSSTRPTKGFQRIRKDSKIFQKVPKDCKQIQKIQKNTLTTHKI